MKKDEGKIRQNAHDNAYVWQLINWLFFKRLTWNWWRFWRSCKDLWNETNLAFLALSVHKLWAKQVKLWKKKEKNNNLQNCPESPQSCSCLTASILIVFHRILKKLVTVGKILKRSFKWAQSGIFSSICLKITSKTREEVKKRENLMTCTNHS